MSADYLRSVSSSSRYFSLLQGANVAAFLATVVVNSLASAFALNGKTTAQVSDAYPTVITPAGYVFSIWSIIYTLLFIFAVFQAFPRQRGRSFLREIGWLFVISSILNISWLFLWHYDQIAYSVLLMFALLASLIAIYLRLNIGRARVSFRERLAVHLPFSVYLGWITVASIANVAVALKAINWDGFGFSEATWGVLVLIVALLITLTVVVTRRDVAYGLVLIWALVGIAVKQSDQSIVLTAEISSVVIAVALVGAGLVSLRRR